MFPQCWDGVNLDAPDHKSHMAYGWGQGANGRMSDLRTVAVGRDHPELPVPVCLLGHVHVAAVQ